MIILKCSQCQEQLEVDDAFAGGVCRCVHCGALSHVPLQSTKLDKKGRPAAPPPTARPVVGTPEELAEVEIVQAREFTAHKKRMGILAILLMFIALAMAGALGYLLYDLFGPADDGPVVVDDTSGLDNPYENEDLGSHICGLEIEQDSVAYCIDTGSSLRYIFSNLIEAVVLSVGTLDDQKFVVTTWPSGGGFLADPDGDPQPALVYPDDGLASPGNTDKLRKWLDDLAPSGSKSPGPAVTAAVTRGAREILLVTNKDLDDDEAAGVRAAVKGKDVKLRAVVVGASDDSLPNLRKLIGDSDDIKLLTEEELSVWTSGG